MTTCDARTNVGPTPSSGATSTQSPSAEVPMAPNLLNHSSASLLASRSRSCVSAFASVMTTFTDGEGYGPQDVSVQSGHLLPSQTLVCADARQRCR